MPFPNLFTQRGLNPKFNTTPSTVLQMLLKRSKIRLRLFQNSRVKLAFLTTPYLPPPTGWGLCLESMGLSLLHPTRISLKDRNYSKASTWGILCLDDIAGYKCPPFPSATGQRVKGWSSTIQIWKSH